MKRPQARDHHLRKRRLRLGLRTADIPGVSQTWVSLCERAPGLYPAWDHRIRRALVLLELLAREERRE